MSERLALLIKGTKIVNLSSVGLQEGISVLADGAGDFAFAPHQFDAVVRSQQAELFEERWTIAHWRKRQDDLIAQARRLVEILREAWQYHFTEWQTEPVYLIVRARGETDERFALVHSAPDLSGANSLFGTSVEAQARAILQHGLTFLRYAWQDGPPGELPAAPKTLVATDGPANPTTVHIANHLDTAQVTHIYNAVESPISSATLTPTYDNAMSLGAPATNFDALPDNYAGNDVGGSNDTWRTLLKFPIVAGLPAGATILTATLRLRVTGDLSGNARTFRVYRLLRAWHQTQSCWNNYSTGNPWTTGGAGGAGTDREAADIGNKTLTAAEPVGTWEEWTLDPAKIEEMLDGGLTDNGFLLLADTQVDDAYQFSSLEGADDPQLVITYLAAAPSFSGNLIASANFPIWSVGGSTPDAADAIYIGNGDATPRTWHHLVLNIGTIGSFMADVVAEYWNGSAWATAPNDAKLTLWPTGGEDEVFKRLGDWVINPGALSDWATTAVNGVTGYWIRLRLNTVTLWTTTPITSAQMPYTQRKPYIEIPATAFAGDFGPHVLMRLHHPYGGDDDEGFPNLSRLIVGAKSRNLSAFDSHLNACNLAMPTNWAAAVGTDASVIADPLAPMGRSVEVTFGTDASLINRCTLTGTGRLPYWIGTYRMFLRARQVGGAAADCSVAVYTRIRGTATYNPATRTALTALGLVSSDVELVDLGILTLPFSPVASIDSWSGIDLIFQIYAQRASGASTLRIYDLILIPIDEWAAQYDDPLSDVATGTSALRGDSVLEVDSGIIRPRVHKLYRDPSTLAVSPMETWRNGGPWPRLEPAIAYRFYFLMAHFRASGTWGTGPMGSTLGQQLSLTLYGRNRYLFLRGDD